MRKFYFLNGYDNTYKINEDGVLMNKNGSLKMLCKEKTGYLTVALVLNGIQKTRLVHRLVATQFIPNPENKPQVNHKNCIKTDNRVENLEWCTRSENQKHAAANGLMPHVFSGENHMGTSLTKEDVIDIYTSGKSMKELRAKYNLSRGNIFYIQSGRSWKSVTAGLERKLPKISQDRIDRKANNARLYKK